MSNKASFSAGLLSIFIISFVLRFWGLGQFDEWVFDEVYYAEFAQNYLTGTPFFDVHPPLGKYLIALGLWLSQWVNHSNPDAAHAETLRISYRWMTAMVGACIPALIATLAYQLTHRCTYALLAGSLTALDGLLLVESRYSLINIYVLAFGLLGQICFVLATHRQGRSQHRWLGAAGLAFGATCSVKWYGLGFWLPIGVLWLGSRLMVWLKPSADVLRPWRPWIKIRLWEMVLYLGVIPSLVYRLVWIPHLQINREYSFWAMQQQIWTYHRTLDHVTASVAATHPYCSPWYSWPIMVRPIAYLYRSIEDASGAIATIYDVHGMGNPMLWWLSTWAILSLLGIVLWQGIRQLGTLNRETIFILTSYGANFLPWMLVSRCSFLYYYMGASLYSFLALAWWIDLGLHSRRRWVQIVSITTLGIIMLAFIYWLPIYLGLPLTPEAFKSRMWFRSWY